MNHKIPVFDAIPLTEKINWIRLCRTTNVGSRMFFKLLKIFGNIDNALNNVEEFAIKGGIKKPVNIYPIKAAQKELEDCYKINANIICFNESQYPKNLRNIFDPPPILTIRGNANLLNQNTLSVIGPRNPSLNGCKFTQMVVSDIGSYNIVIASGLAKGIDAIAHQTALKTGTIAIIAGGINHIYPKENTKLYEQIINEGLLISETPIHLPPKGGSFVQRNRIISAIGFGILVIEATLRSGTLTTARFATEQNKEIFAVPGSPFDPRYEGTNRLIKDGAFMVTNSNDVIDELDQLISNHNRNAKIEENFNEEFVNIETKLPDNKIIDETRKLILEKIDYVPISSDTLINELDIPTKIANIVLVQLELADRIENKNGKICLKA